MRRRFKKLISVAAVLFMLAAVIEPVYATTIDDLQREKEKNQSELNNLNKQISGYKGAQADIGAEIEELDAEIVGLLTDINLIQEAIAVKEEEIRQTQVDYDDALATKEAQYEAMKIRIKFMYEQGDISYLQIFTEAASFGDMLNKVEYVEKIYEYDRKLLEEYQATVEEVAALWDTLEEEKSELQTSEYELEEEQAYVESVLAQKKEEYENYDVILAKAKQEAAAYATKIKQETAQIKKLEEEARRKAEEEARRKAEEEARKKAEEEARRKAEEEAAKKDSDTDDDSDTDKNDDSDTDDDTDKKSNSDSDSDSNSDTDDDSDSKSDSDSSKEDKPASSPSGSSKGQEIANYACKWVGNPYKAGGTSLTDGADCSGFVWAVYKAFGYSLPRSSYAQAGAGRGVSYSEAQPGDIIYYGGHVGIYIGNGQIVHASTQRTGIKYESATYRSIITVRRII